jgi:protease IV
LRKPCCFVIGALLLLASSPCFAGGLAGATDSLAPFVPSFTSDLASTRFIADVDDAGALFVNPAGLGMRHNASTLLLGTYWFDRVSELSAAAAGHGFGAAFSYGNNGVFTSRSWIFGWAMNFTDAMSVGASFNWNHANIPASHRSPFSVDLGFTLRPQRCLSIAGVWKNANRPRFAGGSLFDPLSQRGARIEDTFVGGLSIRPLTDRITLSGQSEMAEDRKPGWLFGGRVMLVPGVELFGTYKRDAQWPGAKPYEEINGGIAFTFGSTRESPSTKSRLHGDYDFSRNSICFEGTDAFKRNSLGYPPRYAEVKVQGSYLDEGGGWSLSGGGSKDLHKVLRDLESVRADKDVKGLLLNVGPLGGAFIGPVSANLCEIREAVLKVKAAGKPVVAYMNEGGSGAEMYLASAADRVVVPRIGTVGLIGVSLQINRMKRMFEKIGVDFDHYTAGDYKSTFHTVYTDSTTAVQAAEIRSLVGESYRLLVEGIASGRNIPVDTMKMLADGRLFHPDDLLKERLVDAIGWEKDAKTQLGKLAGARKPEKLRTSSISGRTYWTDRWTPPPSIAVVGAYGDIKSGESGRNFMTGSRSMGPETVVRQLKAAAKGPGVKAIVLRVDSGGGSALASDEILEEVRRIQTEDKLPVIVSMGDVAASGGYWISMYADAIFADPFTITGSIGVVWFKPVIERLYGKIGVTNEVFKEGEHSDGMSYSRHYTDEEMKMLNGYIDEMYGMFVDKVSEGRKLSRERVREIGGGRVYFGTQALDLKLVDRMGGLKDAIAYAAEKTGIAKDYRTLYYKAYPGFFESLDMNATPLDALGWLGGLIIDRRLGGGVEAVLAN